MPLARLALCTLLWGASAQVLAQARPEQGEGPTEPSPAAAAPPSTGLAPQELEVLSRIRQFGQKEIQAGELARRNGGSDKVKRFGELLVRDHRQADAELRLFVESRDATLTTPASKDGAEPAQLRAEHARLAELEELRGGAFDRRFLDAMLESHAAAIELLQRAREETRDAQLRGLYGRLRPVVRQHHELAQLLRAEIDTKAGE